MSGAPLTLCNVARRTPGATRRLAAVHAALLRYTQGRVAARWFGSRLFVLETQGRVSGLPRTVALVYLPDGDDIVVVPANAGAARPPAWWLNLCAAGEAVAVVDGRRHRVRPVEVTGADRRRLWRRFAALTPVEHYQRHAGRELPVVALRRAFA